MTTRPGAMATDMARYLRTKHLAKAIQVIPETVDPLYLTTHDRKVTVEGDTYTPIAMGSMSAGRAEAAFRSGNQEVRGIIDGDSITIDDMDANRYRGAEVVQIDFDWRCPWIIYGRHRRWIRSLVWDGSTFIGTLESRSQQLQRPAGGRFGGTFSSTCPYTLGAAGTCKKNISSDTVTGVTVDTVADNRRRVTFTAGSWSGSYDDDYYRDGSIQWTSGDNAGLVSPIVGFVDSTKEVSLLIPTVKPIQVGDVGTAQPGCDGLLGTCADKFSNSLNFGGDPFAPSASQIIEPVEDVS